MDRDLYGLPMNVNEARHGLLVLEFWGLLARRVVGALVLATISFPVLGFQKVPGLQSQNTESCGKVTR